MKIFVMRIISLALVLALCIGCKNQDKEGKEQMILTQGQRPNIVWIIADDYSPDAGAYGNDIVKTPNIDRLASQGQIFHNAFATATVCSPSRSALYTGMYQSSIGAQHHRPLTFSYLPDSVHVMTKYLHEAGYFTCNGNGKPDSKPGKTDFNFTHSDSVFQGADWSQRKEDQPFFASVQFYDPHRPFKRDTINPINPDNVSVPPYYPNHPLTKRDFADYLENVQRLDSRIGQVLDRLEKEGLADNTIVFFFSDQGRPMIRGKCWLYDEGIKVPLIIRWPDKINAGTSSDDLVSLIDVCATTLTLAGAKVPAHMQGKDFLIQPEKRNYIYAGRNRIDLAVDYSRCVRSKEFKYISNLLPEKPYLPYTHARAYYYPTYTVMQVLEKSGTLTSSQKTLMADNKPREELYDLKADPYEINNLADDPKYSEILQEYRNELNNWMTRTRDLGNDELDDFESIKAYRQEQYTDRWTERGFDPKNIDWEKHLQWWEKELGIVNIMKNEQ